MGNQIKDIKICTIAFSHSTCSMWQPCSSLLCSYRRSNGLRTLTKIPGSIIILTAATTILATRSSDEYTGVSYTTDFMWPQKKKTIGMRSSEWGGESDVKGDYWFILKSVSSWLLSVSQSGSYVSWCLLLGWMGTITHLIL